MHIDMFEACLSSVVGNDKPSLLASTLASTLLEASCGRLCINVPSLLLLLHIKFWITMSHMRRLGHLQQSYKALHTRLWLVVTLQAKNLA